MVAMSESETIQKMKGLETLIMQKRAQSAEKIARLNVLRGGAKNIGKLDVELMETDGVSATQLTVRVTPDDACPNDPEFQLDLEGETKLPQTYTFETITLRDACVEVTALRGDEAVGSVEFPIELMLAESSNSIEQWFDITADGSEEVEAEVVEASEEGEKKEGLGRVRVRATMSLGEVEQLAADVLRLKSEEGELLQSFQTLKQALLLARSKAEAAKAQARGAAAAGKPRGAASKQLAGPAPKKATGLAGYLQGVYEFNVKHPTVRSKNLWMLKNVAVFSLGVFVFHCRSEHFSA